MDTVQNKVKRIYPESKTGVINWIEENFHEIDQFVATFSLKDGTTMSVYDSFSYLEAIGLAGIQLDCIHHAAHNDEFTSKVRVKPNEEGSIIYHLSQTVGSI
jgi:hypothetical protein